MSSRYYYTVSVQHKGPISGRDFRHIFGLAFTFC